MKVFRYFFLWAAFVGLSLGGNCGDRSFRPEQAGRFETDLPEESQEEIAEQLEAKEFEKAKKEAEDAAEGAVAAAVLLKAATSATTAESKQPLSAQTQALIETANLALSQARNAQTAEEACFIRDNALNTQRRLQNLLDAALLFETKEEEDTDLEN